MIDHRTSMKGGTEMENLQRIKELSGYKRLNRFAELWRNNVCDRLSNRFSTIETNKITAMP